MQSALQNLQQLLKTVADSSVVVAIMTSRFSDSFKAVAAEIGRALQGTTITTRRALRGLGSGPLLHDGDAYSMVS